MRQVAVAIVVALLLTATPAQAQTGGLERDGLSGNTLALHLVIDLLATLTVVGHASMYGNMLATGASTRVTLDSGMGAWPTIASSALAGSAALAVGAVGLASGGDEARTISIVSVSAGSLALACAALDLTLFLLTEESAEITPVVFGVGDHHLVGLAGRF